MPSDKRTAALSPALIVWVLAVAGPAATPGLAVGESLLAAAPRDPSVVERSLEPQRSTRQLIQRALRTQTPAHRTACSDRARAPPFGSRRSRGPRSNFCKRRPHGGPRHLCRLSRRAYCELARWRQNAESFSAPGASGRSRSRPAAAPSRAVLLALGSV